MESQIQEMKNLKKQIKEAQKKRPEHEPYLELLDEARLETLRRADSAEDRMCTTQKYEERSKSRKKRVKNLTPVSLKPRSTSNSPLSLGKTLSNDTPISVYIRSAKDTQSKLRQFQRKRKDLEDRIKKLDSYKSKVRQNVRKN